MTIKVSSLKSSSLKFSSLTSSCLVAAGAIALLAANVSTSVAEPMKISADLKATSETPPNDSKGTGMLTGTFDPATKVLTWIATYADLTGPATMAHFHGPAPEGKPAPVEVPIKGSVDSPIKGEATLTTAQAKDLTDGMTYFNVHTAKNKGGEIRGQVMLAK